jgi:hypothetical protein
MSSVDIKFEDPDFAQDEVDGSADATRQEIPRDLEHVQAVDEDGPEQVRKSALQSIEENGADSNAKYAADSKLEKLNESVNSSAARDACYQIFMHRGHFLIFVPSGATTSASG